MKPEPFPTVGEMIGCYWPIILIIHTPSIASSFMIHLVAENQIVLGMFFLLPFGIIMWLVNIGLYLHIVDHHLEPTAFMPLLKLGGTFWTTIFRAGLLLVAIALAMLLPLVFILRALSADPYRIAQLVTLLAIIKWNLFLQPVLYRDRGLVFDAWATVKKIKLTSHRGLLGLYAAAAFFQVLPFQKMASLAAIPFSFVLMGANVVIGLWALRAVCRHSAAEV
jgi:hypothetical protein